MSSDDGASGTTMGLQTKEKTKQESVWKIEATSAEGCTFICPQVRYIKDPKTEISLILNWFRVRVEHYI